MQDFKIKTEEALFSLLNIKQFSFESLNGRKKEKNQELFQQIVVHMPITEINNGIYYRARKINALDKELVRQSGLLFHFALFLVKALYQRTEHYTQLLVCRFP